MSLTIMAFVETPTIPNNKNDLIFCATHIICIACCNWFCFASMKYINATNCALIGSFEVPLGLLAQMTFLAGHVVGDTGPMQIAGALVVFLAVFTRPIIQLKYGSTATDCGV